MNAELIKALRICANQTCCDNCPRYDIDHTQDAQRCCIQLINDAADALEAANERIVNLLTALHLANEKLAYVDCQPYTEIDGEEMIEDWVKTLVYEELKTQMPKEGEWIMDCLAPQMDEYRIGEWAYAPKCSECGTHWDAKTNYCPNCGAKMKGENDADN